MTSQEMFAGLGEPEVWAGELHRWDEAMAATPETLPPFLATSTIAEKCRAAGLADARVAPLIALADEIAVDPPLRAYAWYLHWRVWVLCDSRGEWTFPTLKPRLGDRRGLLFLLLALELPGRLAAYHRTLGYPPEVTADTARSLGWEEAHYFADRAVPGIYGERLRWLNGSVVWPSVQLGRLVYDLFYSWSEEVIVFRRDADGAVIALANTGMNIDDAGLFPDQHTPPPGCWTSTLTETDDAFSGYPIHPAGRVLRTLVRLPRPGWRKALTMTGVGTTSDATLFMHVPFGGGMGWDKVRDSLRRADAFFRRHHPDRPIQLLTTATWFLDPRLPEVLGVDSNPARFQRACYLLPEPPNPGLLGDMVFQRDLGKTPPDQLPAKTSVQRALIEFMKRGGVWHGGRMIMLPEDMADPREGIYLERFSVLSREFGL